jgi:hypothetical protein
MKMNILITESQEKMLLIESIGNELGDVVTQNENLGKSITNKIKEIIGIDKVGLLTFGATIGGFISPVNQFIEGKFPHMSDVDISLLLTGVVATFFYNTPKLMEKIKSLISEKELESEFEETLSKTKELHNTFFDFMESLNITLFKVSNILGFAFLIPLLPYIHEIAQNNLSSEDIHKIIKSVLSYGVITVSSVVFKEIMIKLIKRFRG